MDGDSGPRQKLFHKRYLTQRTLGKGAFGTAWLVHDEQEDHAK